MNKIRLVLFIFIFICSGYFGQAQNFGGNPASIKWYQINTPKVRVIFPTGLDSQANRITNVLKLLSDSTAATIGTNQRKWNIVLQNQTTIPNAYVRMAPIMSEFYMTPAQNNFSTGSIRWDDNLAIHEHRHIQQFSNFNKGLTKLFSFFLGQEGQLLANGMTVPDYFFEGDAVWQETLVSAQGRGRMPSFYNGFKALQQADKNYSWMKLRSGSYIDYTPDHYQLGYQIVAYGYEKYGADFWKKVTEDAVRFKGLLYPFNKAVERYSGKSYKQFRQDALKYFSEKSPLGSSADTEFTYLTRGEKNNVVDYEFPHFISDDSILVTKKSNKEISAFYIVSGGNETKIRIKDVVIDDYYSYKNGKIVYAAYQSDPRWANRDYSVLKLVDIYTGEQKQLTTKTKYFSPDINEQGTEIIAVSVNTDGTNNLHRINTESGQVISQVPNLYNFFFTQTKFLDSSTVVSAVRNPNGSMALTTINLNTGKAIFVTPVTNKVIGYPFVKNDTVFFSIMYGGSDKVFAVTLSNQKTYRLSNNTYSVYAPGSDHRGQVLVSAFTADGNMLGKYTIKKEDWVEVGLNEFASTVNSFISNSVENFNGYAMISDLYIGTKKRNFDAHNENPVTKYRKSFRLFNFHSWRPVVDDPEFGYSFMSDNVLSNFSSALSYTYNRTDRSHTIGIGSAFAGWFPVLSVGAQQSFNRTVDTAFGKSVQYNAATINAGISVPLRFVGGRTNKFLSFGGRYNIEQYYYRGVGKNVFNNNSIDYINAFLSFSNVSQQAKQHINPRWAQTVSLNYRDAVNVINSHKFVGHASLYFPGLFTNHSFVINTAYQKRDTLADLFSKVFSYSRGYQALSTRRMYKVGVNYHLPLFYPDWGFGNILFFQRIRTNVFYDYTNAKARVNGLLTNIKNRSTGAEIYFDSKLWNALPLSFGVRFSHLMDRDLLNPLLKNRWEILVPIGFIPN